MYNQVQIKLAGEYEFVMRDDGSGVWLGMETIDTML